METNLLERVFKSWEIKMVGRVYEIGDGKDISTETILMGECKAVGYSKREKKLMVNRNIIEIKTISYIETDSIKVQ